MRDGWWKGGGRDTRHLAGCMDRKCCNQSVVASVFINLVLIRVNDLLVVIGVLQLHSQLLHPK